MNIAITGGNGHLGTALCRRLLDDGHHVRALTYRDTRGLQGLPVEIVPGSVSDPEALGSLCRGADTVFHLAAAISIGGVAESALFQTNVEGTRKVLEGCRKNGVRRMIHFSSIHAYRPVPVNEVFDETAPAAEGYPYERSKAAAQALVLAENGNHGLETLCLNPTAVLGPWDYKPSLQGQMLSDLAAERIPVLTPGGFDWVDSRDIASAASAALHRGKPGEAYILSGQFASMLDLARMYCEIAGCRAPQHTLPFWFLNSLTPFITAWGRLSGKPPLFTRESLAHVRKGHPNVSHAKATSHLGYRPRPLQDTLRDTFEWFSAHSKSETLKHDS